jgi:hypothetical protein
MRAGSVDQARGRPQEGATRRTGSIAGPLMALSVSTGSAQEAAKPNILVIMKDWTKGEHR